MLWDITSNLPLQKDDIIMIDNFYYANGIKKQVYIDHVNQFNNWLNALVTKPQVFCVATSTNNNQVQVNSIKTEISQNMINICDYNTIQDDYWADANATVLIPTK